MIDHIDNYRVKSENDFNLSKLETSSTVKKPEEKELKKMLLDDTEKIAALQYKLYAENRQALLIILQGMDSSGKDGSIKHIMSGVNPQGVLVHSFKHPSDLELEHDYLWRHYQKLPEHGQIAIFNRSHYENVLVSKVHPKIVLAERIPGVDSIEKIDKDFWAKRYKQINHFEEIITESGTHILKFFLHISKEEQCKRFLERIENKERHWKFSSSDIIERSYWDDYQKAYEKAIINTNTKHAPWYIIPADDKWFTHLLIGNIILDELKKMNPTLPSINKEEEEFMLQVSEKLKKEAAK